MEFFTTVLFALAVSVDGFMVGSAYGMKKIRLSFKAKIVIAVASATAVTIAMLFGKGLALFFSASTADMIGAGMIMLMGLYFIVKSFGERIENKSHDQHIPLLSFKIRSLGIIVQILKEPTTADLDASGEISVKESWFLGIALAMDAFGAGIGLAMTGHNILCTAITIGMVQSILVSIGLYIGSRLTGRNLDNALSSLLTGIFMILIGTMKMIWRG